MPRRRCRSRRAPATAARERDERRADGDVDAVDHRARRAAHGRTRRSRPGPCTSSSCLRSASAHASGIAATPGNSLPSSSSSDAPPPVETQAILFARPAPPSRAPSRRRRRPCARRHPRPPGRRRSSPRRSAATRTRPSARSRRPSSPSRCSPRSASRVSGPMSRPSQPSGTLVVGTTFDSASGSKATAATTSVGSSTSTSIGLCRGSPRPSCRRRARRPPARPACAARRSCPRPWRRRRSSDEWVLGARRAACRAPAAPARAAAPRRPAAVRDALGRRVRAVRRTERVVDVDVRRGQLLRELGVVRGLARIEARVLEHADALVRRAARQPRRDGRDRERGIRPLRPAEVRADDHLAPRRARAAAAASAAPHGSACRRRPGRPRAGRSGRPGPARACRRRRRRGPSAAASRRRRLRPAASRRSSRSGRRAGSCSPTRCRTSRTP